MFHCFVCIFQLSIPYETIGDYFKINVCVFLLLLCISGGCVTFSDIVIHQDGRKSYFKLFSLFEKYAYVSILKTDKTFSCV